MGLYAKQIRAILLYMETLDQLEDPKANEIGALAQSVPLFDADDPDYALGTLSNPDGIGWEWTPTENLR